MRVYTAKALTKLGDNSAIPTLTNALNDDNGWVRVYAAEALAKLEDKRVIPTLIEVIGDDNQDIETKLEVIQALVKLSRSTHK